MSNKCYHKKLQNTKAERQHVEIDLIKIERELTQ